MWKAAIFDLDGVLLDTEPLQYLAWKNVLSRRGVVFSEGEYRRYTGKTTKGIAEEMASTYGISDASSFSRERKAEIERIICSETPAIMPGALEAVGLFRKRGMGVAIATSTASMKELDAKVVGTGLDRLFSVIVSERDVARGKPHPDLYLKAAERLGVRPPECLAFEDTPPGVQAAKAAGMACFAIPNKYVRRSDLARADKSFASMEEAMAHVTALLKTK